MLYIYIDKTQPEILDKIESTVSCLQEYHYTNEIGNDYIVSVYPGYIDEARLLCLFTTLYPVRCEVVK